MALSVAYSVCITVICLEVAVILGLVLYLCRKPSDAGKLQLLFNAMQENFFWIASLGLI